jgi:ABC-type antimicrobial peptide transport system permease subunit
MNQKIFVTITILFMATYCKNEEKPLFKMNDDNKIKFSLLDKKYKSVALGTDILGKWQLFPMKKNNGYWELYFYDTKKKIQYKYLIDNSYWMRDPSNKNKIQLLPPCDGYNSYIN